MVITASPVGNPCGILCAANLRASRFNLRPAGAVNRAVHAAAAHQRAVGRVDDGVDRLFGDVADIDRNPASQIGFSAVIISPALYYYRERLRRLRKRFDALDQERGFRPAPFLFSPFAFFAAIFRIASSLCALCHSVTLASARA